MNERIFNPGQILTGPLFSEAMRVETVQPNHPAPSRKGEMPEVRCLQPDLETEAIAMRVAMEHKRGKGKQVYGFHEKNLGYDITSLGLNSGGLRLIEVKEISADAGTILLTPNERRVAEDRRDCYWLVTNCKEAPKLQAR